MVQPAAAVTADPADGLADERAKPQPDAQVKNNSELTYEVVSGT